MPSTALTIFGFPILKYCFKFLISISFSVITCYPPLLKAVFQMRRIICEYVVLLTPVVPLLVHPDEEAMFSQNEFQIFGTLAVLPRNQSQAQIDSLQQTH